MSKLKIILGAVVLCGLLVLAIWLPLHFETKHMIEANEARKQARTEEIKKNNPERYESTLKAIEDNKKYLSEHPDDAAIWIELGANQEGLGDYLEAEKAYKKALSITPNTIVAWNNLGNIYREEGQYTKARDAYLGLINSNGAVIEAYMNLAEMYSNNQAGDFDDAVKILELGIANTQKQSLRDTLDRLIIDHKL